MRPPNYVVILSWCAIFTFLLPHEVAGTECVIEAVEDCLDNEENRQIDIRNITVGVLENGKWGLIGLAEVNFRRSPLITLEFTKCASKQEPETCMFFSTVRYKDPCKMLEAKTELWSSFFQNSEPPMKCPVKGLYDFRNSNMDLDSVSKVMPGLEGFYWKIKAVLAHGKKHIGCFSIEISTIKS